MDALLRAEAIGRRASDGGWLVQDLSIEVRAGDQIGIQGPIGAGKSLLLRALALLDPLDGGEILWQGRRVPDHDIPSYRRQVGYLHQNPALVEGTVEWNLRLPFTLGAHRDRAFDPERAIELLQRLGRNRAFLKRASTDLSGGERQIVALVRFLQLDPMVLLLDEPTASLDPESTRRATSLIRRWADNRAGEKSYLWVSHDEELTRQMTTRQLRLEQGRLTEG